VDGGDVVGVVREGLLDLVEAALLGGPHVALDLGGDGEAELGVRNAGPGKLREEVGLLGIGVRDGEGVAAAAVEGLAEVEDLLPLLPGDALRPIAADLPVEGGLERL
jgi:hypothetical protein